MSIGALLPIAGAVAGQLLGDRDGQNERREALRIIQAIQEPNFDMRSLTPEEKRLVGMYAPEMASALQLGPAQQVSTDPRLKMAQMAALKQMQDVANSQGMDLASKASLNEVVNRQATANRGQQEAIMQNMRSRGVAGGGQEAAMRMIAQQAEADRAADMGLSVHGQARQNALQAMMGSGSMAGQMRSQDFSVADANRNAINSFNMANWKNQQDVMNSNVNNRNSAQQYNLGQQQSISNSNVDNRNAYEKYNQQNQNNLRQQQFSNQMSKAGAQTTQLNNISIGQDNRAVDDREFWNGLGQAGGAYATKKGF